MIVSIQLETVRFTDKPWAEAGFVGRPGAGDPPAEDRWAEHGSFQTGFAVNMTSGHAGDFARGVKSGNRFEVFVQHAAAKVGLHTAKVFARQRKNLNRVVRRRVELFRAFERLAEPGLLVEPRVEAFIVFFYLRDKVFDVFHAGFLAQVFERVALFDIWRIFQKLLNLGAVDDIAPAIIGIGDVDLRQHRR